MQGKYFVGGKYFTQGKYYVEGKYFTQGKYFVEGKDFTHGKYFVLGKYFIDGNILLGKYFTEGEIFYAGKYFTEGKYFTQGNILSTEIFCGRGNILRKGNTLRNGKNSFKLASVLQQTHPPLQSTVEEVQLRTQLDSVLVRRQRGPDRVTLGKLSSNLLSRPSAPARCRYAINLPGMLWKKSDLTVVYMSSSSSSSSVCDSLRRE
jgi:hypothetical protein